MILFRIISIRIAIPIYRVSIYEWIQERIREYNRWTWLFGDIFLFHFLKMKKNYYKIWNLIRFNFGVCIVKLFSVCPDKTSEQKKSCSLFYNRIIDHFSSVFFDFFWLLFLLNLSLLIHSICFSLSNNLFFSKKKLLIINIHKWKIWMEYRCVSNYYSDVGVSAYVVCVIQFFFYSNFAICLRKLIPWKKKKTSLSFVS